MHFSIRRPLFFCCFLSFFISSCYNPKTSQIMQDMRQLSGSWESYKGVKFSENWRYMNDKLLEGEGFSLNGRDTSFYESLSIAKKGDSIFYRVYIGGDNQAVDFLLIEASKKSWTFINPDNEFPQKIVYDMESDGILLVTISDMKVNKKQRFYLKKNR